MTTIALLARVVLAGVFAVAAAAKLADRKGTRDAVVAFGAPTWGAAGLALALPVAELAVAGLLLPSTTAVAGALGAAALLAVFTAAIVFNLARGKAPECHCFGQLHSAPVGWRTLARNAVLLAAAGIALAGSLVEPAPSAVAWIGDLEGAELLALVVAIAAAGVLGAVGAAFLTLMRSYGTVLVRLDRLESALAGAGIALEEDLELPEIGLAPGAEAPAFELANAHGETVTLGTLLEPGLPVLLLFTSPHCGPCAELLPVAAEWQQHGADRLTVAFASDGTADEVRAETAELELENVLLDAERRVSEAYETSGTPSAVVIAADGTIASWVAAGREHIERVIDQVLGGADGEQGLPLGAEAPALELASLGGERVSVADLRGRDSLLLFWNPECGYCRGMHDDLLAWEQSANGVTPRLVVVSSGDEESTRAEGFRSLVLLDGDFEAGTAFGAGGTPMAVLLDADGRIAAPLAAGAEAVFALANGRG